MRTRPRREAVAESHHLPPHPAAPLECQLTQVALMNGKDSARRQAYVYKCGKRTHWTGGPRSIASDTLSHYESVLRRACAATCGATDERRG